MVLHLPSLILPLLLLLVMEVYEFEFVIAVSLAEQKWKKQICLSTASFGRMKKKKEGIRRRQLVVSQSLGEWVITTWEWGWYGSLDIQRGDFAFLVCSTLIGRQVDEEQKQTVEF